MAIIQINLKISDREYPMKIEASEEEAIRQAGKEISERMKHYQTQFKMDDRQDLMAMVAFDIWMEKAKQEGKRLETESYALEKIGKWDTLLSSILVD